jgi:hypothetical protein
VHRDYKAKGVEFYFIYKSLAHPELTGNYVQPFTLDERLAHARQAEQQLGATIPWIVDAMDNRLKHALGDRPNSEFVVNAEGIIVSKRAWSHPAEVRKDLEKLVGPVDRITPEDEVQLRLALPLKAAAARGVVPPVRRRKMQALVIEPQLDPDGSPFFAKLRAEGDEQLLSEGSGKLYLGFHLDPFHNAHWNNLTRPLSWAITRIPELRVDRLNGEAPQVEVASDADPREFLLNVEKWPDQQPLELTVSYFACVGEETCHTVTQKYRLLLQRDKDAGNARSEGAGFWEKEEFSNQLISGDQDNDGQLSRSEVRGLILPHFDALDTSQDGLLNREELLKVADWLNDHHQPGIPQTDTKVRP